MLSKYNTQNQHNSQDRDGIFSIYKYPGETLASLLDRFRTQENLSHDVPITYAGRLDPMAEGLMLLLVGEKCKEKDSFLGLDKTYTFEILFGVGTDTFDMLGLIVDIKEVSLKHGDIEGAIQKIKNKTVFSYPPFSSKPFEGKPLFMHAKEGTLPKEMPTIRGEIHSSVLQNTRMISTEEVVEKSVEIIKKVEGDFRQEGILKGWQNFLNENKSRSCFIATCEATVSSGVYIRSIAVEIGQILGVPALAYSIKRTRVGKYLL